MKNRVKEKRLQSLMTQQQLATKAGLAIRTIHSVEKGLNLRGSTKRSILKALSIPRERWHKIFPELNAYREGPKTDINEAF